MKERFHFRFSKKKPLPKSEGICTRVQPHCFSPPKVLPAHLPRKSVDGDMLVNHVSVGPDKFSESEIAMSENFASTDCVRRHLYESAVEAVHRDVQNRQEETLIVHDAEASGLIAEVVEMRPPVTSRPASRARRPPSQGGSRGTREHMALPGQAVADAPDPSQSTKQTLSTVVGQHHLCDVLAALDQAREAVRAAMAEP